jgi:hypothetical protein
MKLLLNISKYLAALGTVSAVVWGGYKIYDTIIDTQEMVVDVWSNQNVIEANINIRLESIEDSLVSIEKKVDANSKDLFVTKKLMEYEREHRGEYTQEQLNRQLREIEDLLTKKNTSETVYTGSDYDITEHVNTP